MAAKAEELLVSVGKKLKKVVGFGRVLIRIIQKVAEDKEQVITQKYDSVTALNNRVVEKGKVVNEVFEPVNRSDTANNSIVYAEVFEDEVPGATQGNIQRYVAANPEVKIYIDSWEKKELSFKRFGKALLVHFLLTYYQDSSTVSKLEQYIKDSAEALYTEYNDLVTQGLTEDQIVVQMEQKVSKTILTYIDKLTENR